MTTLSQRDESTIWHPYTQHQMADSPLPISRGEGAYLFDQQDKPYLDLISSWWVNIHGHAHPRIAKAIYEQALRLEQVIFSGFTHEPAVRLAENLLTILPSGFSKIFYSDNGSTAVEVALKMAYQYWRNQEKNQRQRILAFSGSYHGDTFGAMSIGRSSHFFEHYSDLLFKVDFMPYPDTWHEDEGILEKERTALQCIEAYFQQHQNKVAALIIEPLIQGANGMRICRAEFLSALEKLARSQEVLIIYDEVMTGFGRTGARFACEKAKTLPDIICLSKGLTGGFLPLAVTACREVIYQAFLNDHIDYALMHGHSYTANPLGCAAALASLSLLEEAATKQQITCIEEVHQKMLAKLKFLPGVEKIRQCGTMAAFDLKIEAAYGSALSQAWRSHFSERGLLVRPLGKTIYLLPPYCIKRTDLENAYFEIIEVVEQITQGRKHESCSFG